MVQHLDLAPTMLEVAGASAPASMEGKSLWPLATGARVDGGWDRVVCCESTWQSKWALRSDTRKLILAREQDHHGMPPRELYDLVADPEETRNLADAHPEETAGLEVELENWIAAGLERANRSVDPLVAQGITLGKRWDARDVP